MTPSTPTPAQLECVDAIARLGRGREGVTEPTTCPRGNPIPSANGEIAGDESRPLHRLRAGQHAVVIRIDREEPELLRYLATLGLLPDARLEVEEVGALGGPMLVRLGASRYALGRKVAAHIRVRPL